MTAAPHTPASVTAPAQGPFGHGAPGLPGVPATPAAPATEGMAVAALVSAFVVPVVGVVLGVVARGRVARNGTAGRGLATAAVVLGSVFSAMWVLTVVAVIALGSVSFSASTAPSVPASSVEARIVAEAGLTPGSVTCPQDLPATVGGTVTCSAVVADGTSLPVDVTVTSVAGDDVRFSFTSR